MITSILLDALQYLGYILIFPGFLFCFVIGLLLCGIDRKLVARMQKRVGPPILQPFYDFFKLMGNTDQQELEAFYEIYQELVDDYREAYVIANAHRQERIISKLKEHGLDDEKYEKLMMLSIMSMEATAHKMVCTRLLDASKASDDVKK